MDRASSSSSRSSSTSSVLGKRNLSTQDPPQGETPAKRPQVLTSQSSRVPQDTKGTPDAPVLVGTGLPRESRLVPEDFSTAELSGKLGRVPDDVQRDRYGTDSDTLVRAFGAPDIRNIIAEYSTAQQDRMGQWLDAGMRGRPVPVEVHRGWALHDEIAARLAEKDPDSVKTQIHGVAVQLCELQRSTTGGDMLVFKTAKGHADALEKWGARPDPGATGNTHGSDIWAFRCSLADLVRTLKSDHPLCRRYEPLARLLQGCNRLPSALALLPCLQGGLLDLRETPFRFSQVVPDGKSPGQPLVRGSGWHLEPVYKTTSVLLAPLTVLKLLDSYAKDLGGRGIEELHVPADLPFYGPAGKCEVQQFLTELIGDMDSLDELRRLSVEIPPGLSRIDLHDIGTLEALKLHTGAACMQAHLIVVTVPEDPSGVRIAVQDSLAHKVLFECDQRIYTPHMNPLSKLTFFPPVPQPKSWVRPLVAFEIVPGMVITIEGRAGMFAVNQALRTSQGGIRLQLTPCQETWTPTQAGPASFKLHLSGEDLAGGSVRRAAEVLIPQHWMTNPKERVSHMQCDFAHVGHVYDLPTASGTAHRVVLDRLSVIPEFDRGTMSLRSTTPEGAQGIEDSPGWVPYLDEDNNEVGSTFNGTIDQLKAQTSRLTYVGATPPQRPEGPGTPA